MKKFNNIKVKRFNSHLKYIVSKLVKKRQRKKHYNTGITQKKAIRKKTSRKEATRKKTVRKEP